MSVKNLGIFHGTKHRHEQVTEKETPNASNLGAKEALFHGGFGSFIKPSPPPFCCFSGCYMKGSEVGEMVEWRKRRLRERERLCICMRIWQALSLSILAGARWLGRLLYFFMLVQVVSEPQH